MNFVSLSCCVHRTGLMLMLYHAVHGMMLSWYDILQSACNDAAIMTGDAVHACASLHLVTGAEDLVPFAPQH